MHHRVGIDLGNALFDPLLEFRFGLNPNMPEEGPAHLGKQGFDQVEQRSRARD